jgi:glutamine synthetase
MDNKESEHTVQKLNDNEQVRFAVSDIDGILRGKNISVKKLKKSFKNDFGFCNVIFGWDSEDRIYDGEGVTGWHTGFPDSKITLDLSTFRRTPWNHDIPFFLADFRHSKELSQICPRSLLHTVVQEAAELGYKPKFATEYEWYNFQKPENGHQTSDKKNPETLTPGMFGYSMLRTSQYSGYVNDLFRMMREFGVPLESIHTETGDGAYEAAIEYADAVEAADRSILFKSGVKEIAYQHGISASFMAKWNMDLPGSGAHVHQSIWDTGGSKNLFFDEDDPERVSPLMRHYIAGQLHCLPHILPMYAPTVNSYKRFVKGSWASTTVSWGFDNRTTAIRAISAGNNGTRVELRVPGADANPYLAIAASLASGLYGIKHKLEPEQPTNGNEYENKQASQLPATLKEAISKMKTSEIAQELFGEVFTSHFLKTREWECEQFEKNVTDWEIKRYFEII